MLIAGLLAIHTLLLLAWVWKIARGTSRLHLSHILFAACLPFVGELCLLACECVALPRERLYRSLFLRPQPYRLSDDWTLPEDWQTILSGPEEEARAFLLLVTRHRPKECIQVYQAGLTSENSEVCHLCASALQKEHDRHEDEIALAESRLAELPGNAGYAEALLRALKNYRSSGLLDQATAQNIQLREQHLLHRWPSLEAQDRSEAV